MSGPQPQIDPPAPIAPVPTFRKDHVPELDGLRAIAVLCILWVHLPASFLPAASGAWRQWLVPGNLGMDLFFVLSGFLITRILLVEREAPHALRDFLVRRCLRIFPIYFLTIAVLLPLLSWKEVGTLATYTANYAFLFLDRPSFLKHAWSLAVEEQFYLVWSPLVVWLSWRASRAWMITVAPILVAATVLAAFRWGDWIEHDRALRDLFMWSTTTRIGALGAGALLAYHEPWIRERTGRTIGLVLLAGGLAGLLSEAALERIGVLPRLVDWLPTGAGQADAMLAIRLVSVPAVALALVALAVGTTGRRTPWGMVWRAAPLRWIGRISYGLYLFHYPVLRWVRRRSEDPAAPEDLHVALGVVAAFAIATASYWVIERPLLRWARRFRSAA